MTEPVTPARRAALNVRRLISILLARVRRVLGILLQVAERDQLRALTHETRRLSSASVESVTHLGGELRALDERLSRVEEQLAEVRRLLEARQSPVPADIEDTEEVAAERSSAR